MFICQFLKKNKCALLTIFPADDEEFVDGRFPVNHESKKRDEKRLPLLFFLGRQNHATFQRMRAVQTHHRRTSRVDQGGLHQQLKMQLQRSRILDGQWRGRLWFLENKYRGGTSDATTSSSLIVPLLMTSKDDASPLKTAIFVVRKYLKTEARMDRTTDGRMGKRTNGRHDLS